MQTIGIQFDSKRDIRVRLVVRSCVQRKLVANVATIAIVITVRRRSDADEEG